MKKEIRNIFIRNHKRSVSSKPELKEEIQQEIRTSIRTARYKNLDPLTISNIHLDGER